MSKRSQELILRQKEQRDQRAHYRELNRALRDIAPYDRHSVHLALPNRDTYAEQLRTTSGIDIEFAHAQRQAGHISGAPPRLMSHNSGPEDSASQRGRRRDNFPIVESRRGEEETRSFIEELPPTRPVSPSRSRSRSRSHSRSHSRSQSLSRDYFGSTGSGGSPPGSS